MTYRSHLALFLLRALLLTLVAGGGTASAQITAPGTDYPTFWSGELRIFAQKPDTRVTILDLNTATPLGLSGGGADPRITGGPCYIVSADGTRTEDPTNPFVLPDRGSMFRCTGGLGGPEDEIQARVLTESANGGNVEKPVTLWTGSRVEQLDNSWASFLPADFVAGQIFGRELGTSFLGFTQSELILIVPKSEGTAATMEVQNLDENISLTLTLDASVSLCPDLTDTVPPISPGLTPCYLHNGTELQVLYIGGYDDDRVEVVGNVELSVLTGHRLMAFVPDDRTLTHESADWTATPPSWAAGDDGLELGTVFYTFVRQALTIFPTEHDTTVEILDLSDGDDSRTVFLEHGDLVHPKVPGEARLTVYTPFLETRAGNGLVPRTSSPLVDFVSNNENPLDNDVVKVVSDKPILFYQGPAGSDVNEFADVAFSVQIGPQERLVYAYAQNFGGSNDLQIFSFPGDSSVSVTSLSFTRDFPGRLGTPAHHDFLIEFGETEPPLVTPSPDHDLYVTNGIPGSIQHFGSGAWSGELLLIRSERPLTVINGDYDTPHFGAYVPFIPTSRTLPPVAVISFDEQVLCPGSALLFDASGSFDQDPEGPDPQIRQYDWDFGDGTTFSSTEPQATHVYDLAGAYLVTLTVTDNEGEIDDDFLVVEVLPQDNPDCLPASCEPRTQGYWHRQCLGLGEISKGKRPRRSRPPVHPDWTEDELRTLLAAVEPELQVVCDAQETTCEALDPRPRRDPCERACKQYAALLLNLQSDLLENRCCTPVGSVQDVVEEIRNLLLAGRCRRANELADAVNTGEILTECQP